MILCKKESLHYLKGKLDCLTTKNDCQIFIKMERCDMQREIPYGYKDPEKDKTDKTKTLGNSVI